MWTSTNFVESITERDLDLLLLEELVCCAAFRTWFLHSVLHTEEGAIVFLGALHSVSNELGESDLVIGFRRQDGREFAVLVENKIDADFQPNQAERYHKRGAKGVEAGQWQSFVTCIIAPKTYLTADESGAGEFHNSCTYEALEEWFLAQRGEGEARARFKAQLLRYAIDKSRRRLPAVIAPAVTAFWLAYWQMLTVRFPQLKLARPGAKGPNAEWPTIGAARLPRRTSLIHKWPQGNVDLQISGAAKHEDQFRSAVSAFLPTGISVEVPGKSLALRIIVPALDPWKPFDGQQPDALLGLAAAAQLAEVGPSILEQSGIMRTLEAR